MMTALELEAKGAMSSDELAALLKNAMDGVEQGRQSGGFYLPEQFKIGDAIEEIARRWLAPELAERRKDQQRIADLERRVAGLALALREYGRHSLSCRHDCCELTCTCGLSAALDAANAKEDRK